MGMLDSITRKANTLSAFRDCSIKCGPTVLPMHVCMYLCVYVCVLYVSVWACWYRGTYVDMYVCVYVCMHLVILNQTKALLAKILHFDVVNCIFSL